jgi:uncharacterized protein YjdB
MNTKLIWDRPDDQAVRRIGRVRAGKEPAVPKFLPIASRIEPVDVTVKDTVSYNNSGSDVVKLITIFSVPVGKVLKMTALGITILDQVALSDMVNYLKWFDWRLNIGQVTAPYFNPTPLSWQAGSVWAELVYDVVENQTVKVYVNQKDTSADPGAPTGDLNIACRITGMLENLYL